MRGALLITGTTSDAGKSTLAAGLCRHLARSGLSVAPFKAQNMALNSTVTADGCEIGRAQALQAAACGIPAEAAMNPVLLKPTGQATSQVVVGGHPVGVDAAADYRDRAGHLAEISQAALAGLRERFDVVVCEGAGSPAEPNLRATDFTNLGLARAAGLPAIVVGDIDRGGVLAAFHGTLATLAAQDQRHVAGFVVNKFRGDPALLQPGLATVTERTGRPVLGVVPHTEGLWADAEDSLALSGRDVVAEAPLGRDGLDVAVIALPRLSNVTDADALAAEPGVSVRLAGDAPAVATADLVIVPGSKHTVGDLAWLRQRGIDAALADRAARGAPIVGVCGGAQMLGARIVDHVESHAGEVAGLGLAPLATEFADAKQLGWARGHSPALDGAATQGYRIAHGRVTRHGGQPLLVTDDGGEDGCAAGAVLATTWHGVAEADGWRRALLTWVAAAAGKDFVCGDVAYAQRREARLEAMADLVAAHCDTDALAELIDAGVPEGLPTLASTLQPAPHGAADHTPHGPHGGGHAPAFARAATPTSGVTP